MSAASPPASPASRLQGEFVLHGLTAQMDKVPKGPLDLTGLTALDTAGAWLILSRANGAEITGATPDQMILLDAVRAAMPPAARPPRPPRHVLLLERVDRVGRATAAAVLGLGRIISFLAR